MHDILVLMCVIMPSGGLIMVSNNMCTFEPPQDISG